MMWLRCALFFDRQSACRFVQNDQPGLAQQTKGKIGQATFIDVQACPLSESYVRNTDKTKRAGNIGSAIRPTARQVIGNLFALERPSQSLTRALV